MHKLKPVTKHIRKFCENGQGDLTLFQPPNAALIGWAVCMVAAKISPASTLKSSFAILSLLFLSFWATLEFLRGDSNFRKLLGAIFLLGIIMSQLQALF